MSWDIERLLKELERQYLMHDIAVQEHVVPLTKSLQDDPDHAIDTIHQVYEATVEAAYRESSMQKGSFALALAGGPSERVTWPFYNAVGAAYPYFSREQKDKVLKQLLRIFDVCNYGEINGGRGVGHTTGIHEPLLLADINIIRPLYWPGLDEARYWIKSDKTFEYMATKTIDENGLFRQKTVMSSFCVAYGILRSDFCDWGKAYVQIANPAFLRRTLQGIVAMRFAHAETKEDIEQGRSRLRELLPSSVHDQIEPLRQEGNWVDYKKFNRH